MQLMRVIQPEQACEASMGPQHQDNDEEWRRTVQQFWNRVSCSRFRVGTGHIEYCTDLRQALESWDTRIVEILSQCLRQFEPKFESFCIVARGFRPDQLHESRLNYLLERQAAAAFYDLMVSEGIPHDIAARACTVYRIKLNVDPPGT
jgi:hypothetical protein